MTWWLTYGCFMAVAAILWDFSYSLVQLHMGFWRSAQLALFGRPWCPGKWFVGLASGVVLWPLLGLAILGAILQNRAIASDVNTKK